MLVGLYCFAMEKPKILDHKTLVVCREGKITYELCPPGFRYFDAPKCEPEMCLGKPDGTRVPLPDQHIGPLSFSPGYAECLNEKVKLTHTCPQEWDTYMSKGENLTHLPQVFDGQKCTIPELCVNVIPDDSDVIVPVHEYTKHVRNWILSRYFDRAKGYQCEGTKRKRVALEPGKIINAKRMKTEVACEGSTENVIIANSHTDYFDCKTDSVKSCPANEFFDGFKCRKSMSYPFKYDGLELFELDSLTEDNWIVPWDYGKEPDVTPCQAPETEYLKTYNICSHPDCVLYPWLSQIAFEVALRDGSLCKFDKQTRHIQKEYSDDKYLYWAQRRVDQINPNEECIPGQNIQSGNFIFDKTIYATCDDKQPFVFCPSSDTRGIQLVSAPGRQTTYYWACVPSSMKSIVPPHTKAFFHENEVKQLSSTSTKLTEATINGKIISLSSSGYVERGKMFLETMDEPVEVEYAYRVTHPPEVGLPDQVSKFSGAFLIKRKDFTRFKVHIPRYGIKESLSAFEL